RTNMTLSHLLARPAVWRLCAFGLVAALASLLHLTAAPPSPPITALPRSAKLPAKRLLRAPAPRPKMPQGNRAQDLSLTLTITPAKYELRGAVSCKLVLTNLAKRDLRLTALSTYYQELVYAPGLTFLLRFKDGTVVEVRNESPMVPADAALVPALEPIKIASEGSKWGDWGRGFVTNSGEAIEAVAKCKQFCVTAIVDKLGLKSNTVFVNGTFNVPRDHDPLKDAKAYRRRKADEKERSEAERRRLRERINRGGN